MKKLRRNTYLLLLLLSFPISHSFSQETDFPCVGDQQTKAQPLHESRFDQIFKLAAQVQAVKKVEEKCSIPFMSEEKFKNKAVVTVTVQMGFIDEDSQPWNVSNDRKIIQSIMSNFEEKCDFTPTENDEELSLERTETNGQKLKIVFLPSSPKNGIFDLNFTKRAAVKFENSRNSSDYITTIGHSRLGRGFDLYPLKMSKPIEIYRSQYVKALPENLTGVAHLACDSTKYSIKQGAKKEAEKRGLKHITLDSELFPFKDSVREFFKTLQKF